MFGKLLKHELKHTARYHFAIIIANIVATAIMGVVFIPKNDSLLSLTTVLLFVVSATIMYATIIVSLVAVIKNFYDTIFSRQGYLTLTLPVKGSQLLASKVIISFFWIIVSFFMSALPSTVLSKCLQQLGVDEAVEKGATMALGSPLTTVTTIVYVVAIVLIVILSYVTSVYFSVTLANTRLFSKHPKLFGSIIFITINVSTLMISNFISRFINISLATTADKVFITLKEAWELGIGLESFLSLNFLLVSALTSALLLFATGYFIEHKINIK